MFLLDDKDIIFEVADGELEAHSVVLKASSDVFKQMLQSQMSEGTSRRISLPEVSVVAMKVFLRLLYTGRVDVSDWVERSEDYMRKPGKGAGKRGKSKSELRRDLGHWQAKGKGKGESSDEDSSSDSAIDDDQLLLPFQMRRDVKRSQLV